MIFQFEMCRINAIDPKTRKILQLLRLRQVFNSFLLSATVCEANDLDMALRVKSFHTWWTTKLYGL